MQDLLQNLPVFLAATAVIVALSGTLLSFSHLRKTIYKSELGRIELDHSRKVMEREIEKLHEIIYKDGSRLYELNHLLVDSLKARSETLEKDYLDISGGPASFLKSMGIDFNAVEIDPNFAFVLTPLNSNQLAVYEVIKDECQKVGLRVRRGDETRIDGPILPHIIREIVTSRFVIANINGRNPNVFYELGIAQALGKPAILIVKSYDDVPFDLKQQQIVIYDDIDELPEKFGLSLSRFAFSSK